MLLTEEEAKKKECYSGKSVYVQYCTASDCMAWRESKKYTGGSKQLKDKGFCGLAGRVE